MGGRISKSDSSYDVKHFIILPNKCHVSIILVRSVHVQIGHLGRASMLSTIRQ